MTVNNPYFQPTGKVVDLASRFDPARWNRIRQISSPMGAAAPRGSYEFWFNYFWDEAATVPGLSTADQAKLSETFFTVLEEGPGANGWRLRADFQRREDYFKLKQLRNMLHIGFERVPYLDEDRETRGTNPNQGIDATTLFLEAVQVGDSGDVMKIGYRGDGRDYETLIEHKGFRTRARQEGVSQAYGLNQPWHPYSLYVYRNSIFLRRGKNKDNCLHTAVSIGTDFKMLVHFPILTDRSLYDLPLGPIESWRGGEASTAEAKYAVRVGRDTLGSFLEHDTQIYVVKIDDKVEGFDTEAWQARAGKDPFAERSVNQVPIENLLAQIVVTRKYWWDVRSGDASSHAWQFFDVECSEIRLLPDTTTFVARYSSTTADHLRNHLDRQFRTAKQRDDIRGDRERRRAFLSQPRPGPARAQTAGGVTCPDCGAQLASRLKLIQHQNSTCPKA